MSPTKTVTDKLTEEPYATIICYPKTTRKELAKRLKELKSLGITKIELTGPKQILNTHVLGKGSVGLVTVAHRNNVKVALKIRRTDAPRETMKREAQLLKKANQTGVGPKLIDATKNFLIMQLVEGEMLPQWLEKTADRATARKVLRDILEQCRRLDTTGLDHGQLSHAPKHVIIDKENTPHIIDFETASQNRRPSNLTSISQYLFISRTTAKANRKLGLTPRKSMIEALRRYKNNMNQQNFQKVLESCGL